MYVATDFDRIKSNSLNESSVKIFAGMRCMFNLYSGQKYVIDIHVVLSFHYCTPKDLKYYYWFPIALISVWETACVLSAISVYTVVVDCNQSTPHACMGENHWHSTICSSDTFWIFCCSQLSVSTHERAWLLGFISISTLNLAMAPYQLKVLQRNAVAHKKSVVNDRDCYTISWNRHQELK